MVDYEYKSAVLASGLCEVARAVDFAFYLNYYNLENPFAISLEHAQELFDHWGDTEEYKEARKINHAFYERTKRLRKRVAKLLELPCVFLSLTFSDDALSNTTASTRRKYVTSYLRENYPNYVANIDFGKEHGREHYHAIIQTAHVNYHSWHKLGGVKGERICAQNIEALSKYVSKLTNHAIKETTKRTCIIYSR